MRDGNVLAGSIKKVDGKWLVEIMWTGPTGDMIYEADTLPNATAFVDGVGVAFEAMETETT